ncbi:transposase [Streptomyces mirabilis]|uniref:transposase n=1 Tax=Streptomyces mirabilis TaxID=68239 RepID=UPI00352EA682
MEDRQVISSMVCKIRNRISWRDLPERCGPWKTVRTRFRRCALDGVFTWFLRGCPGLQAGKESDSCGAGQGTGFLLQGERPSTRSGSVVDVRCENQARTLC